MAVRSRLWNFVSILDLAAASDAADRLQPDARVNLALR
jgi:hypothetical protein